MPQLFSLCLVLALSASTLVPAQIKEADLHKIGPDLYAYISANDNSANATFLVGRDGILVVDTGLNTEEGQKLAAAIRTVSSLPVKYIVNTHYHADHQGGNRAVGPNAVAVSTDYTRQRTLELMRASGSQAIPDLWPAGITFAKKIVIYLGNYQVEVRHPGPAHTLGDAVVYFPQQRAVALGDLFLTNSSPAMDKGSLENWILTLQGVLQLPVKYVVPGHFELASKKELRRFHDYLSALRDQVRKLHESGASVGEVRQKIDLSKFQDFRQYPGFRATFADNAETYYHQLSNK